MENDYLTNLVPVGIRTRAQGTSDTCVAVNDSFD